MERPLSQKIQILKFVAEQGIVTVGNVKDWLGHSDKSDVARVTMNRLGIAFMPFGGITHGIRYIDNQELLDQLNFYESYAMSLRPMSVNMGQVYHYLGLNEIRIQLQKVKDIQIIQ